jgi:hypothetical protein
MHPVVETVPSSPKSGVVGAPTETVLTRRVYEQRWSHLLHAGGILMFISPPFMRVLGLTPTSVLAGLFLFMGEQSLAVNPILYRLFDILTPRSELPPLPDQVRGYRGIHTYTAVQVVVTIGIFLITLTKAAPSFPIFIIGLVPVRLFLMKRWWHRDTLRFVDAWACRAGTPEDDEDAQSRTKQVEPTGEHGAMMMARAEQGEQMVGAPIG